MAARVAPLSERRRALESELLFVVNCLQGCRH